MKDGLDKAKDIAQIVSLIAIPLVVAVLGMSIQSTLKNNEIRRDYVQIAVGILSAPDVDSEIREWATQVLQENSPTPFGNSVSKGFSRGIYITPGIPAPAGDLMAPEPTGSEYLSSVSENMSRWEQMLHDLVIK